jgi:SAM-dependent methyltransferase
MTATATATAVALRDETGASLGTARRWFRPADPADLRALATVDGPALDVGCGPGRHVVALAERGIPTLGIDITASALAHARARGAPVLHRCVFDAFPGVGRWRSVILLDGNLGVGGDPEQLLRRVGRVLAPGGAALVEVAATAERPGERHRVVLEIDGVAGPAFDWTVVDRAGLDALTARLGWSTTAAWCDDDRWFAWVRPPHGAGTR